LESPQGQQPTTHVHKRLRVPAQRARAMHCYLTVEYGIRREFLGLLPHGAVVTWTTAKRVVLVDPLRVQVVGALAVLDQGQHDRLDVHGRVLVSVAAAVACGARRGSRLLVQLNDRSLPVAITRRAATRALLPAVTAAATPTVRERAASAVGRRRHSRRGDSNSDGGHRQHSARTVGDGEHRYDATAATRRRRDGGTEGLVATVATR